MDLLEFNATNLTWRHEMKVKRRTRSNKCVALHGKSHMQRPMLRCVQGRHGGSGVNVTNILHTAFTPADHKSTKRQSTQAAFFAFRICVRKSYTLTHWWNWPWQVGDGNPISFSGGTQIQSGIFPSRSDSFMLLEQGFQINIRPAKYMNMSLRPLY